MLLSTFQRLPTQVAKTVKVFTETREQRLTVSFKDYLNENLMYKSNRPDFPSFVSLNEMRMPFFPGWTAVATFYAGLFRKGNRCQQERERPLLPFPLKLPLETVATPVAD